MTSAVLRARQYRASVQKTSQRSVELDLDELVDAIVSTATLAANRPSSAEDETVREVAVGVGRRWPCASGFAEAARGLVTPELTPCRLEYQGSMFSRKAISLGYAAGALAALDGGVCWHLGASVRVP